MERYRRLLLCIGHPESDCRLLGYTGAISRRAQSEEVHLLHVEPWEIAPLAAVAVDEPAAAPVTTDTLAALADEHFDGHGKEDVRCEVVRGAPLIEVLRYAHEKDIDLIVVGRSAGTEEPEAVLARRITRKATCSVLVLPPDAQIKAGTVLVPVRDSECSANALSVACGIAAATDARVVALNVYQVHGGYSRIGTSLQEHEAILENLARHEGENLLRRVDCEKVKVLIQCTPDLHNKPVPIILETIASESADAVVIGARGRTGAAGVLLGKVTEQLIQHCPLPLLAVKKKNECIGVLRALLTITGQE